ncbi:MAG: hypothetical protein LUQ24_07385 [Methanobacterium sp.]|nr:hypothetical protein [Methanobacterium sp.]
MEYEKEFMGKESTFWLENCPGTNFPPLKEGLKVDVAVLGRVLWELQQQHYLKNQDMI